MKVIYSDISNERFSNLKKYIDFLSPNRKDKINCFKFEKDKIRSIFSELLLNYALKIFYNIDLKDCKIHFNIYGKPYIDHEFDLKYNLSHSGDIVICSISTNNIGVDIEENISLNLDTVINCLHTVEREELDNCKTEERIKLFYDYWVLKESYLKYLGIGLQYPVEKLGFNINNEQINVISDLETEKNTFFKLLNISVYYSAAVCCENSEEIELEMIEPDILKKHFENGKISLLD